MTKLIALKHWSYVLWFLAFAIVVNAKTPEVPPSVSVQEKKIVNKTSSPNADFSVLVSLLKHELFLAGFRVVDEADMGNALMEMDKSGFYDGMDGDAPVEGNLKIPGYFLRVTVLQYGFMKVQEKNWVNGKVTEFEAAQVQISYDIIDARTAEMKGTAMTKSAAVPLGGQQVSGGASVKEQALLAAIQESVHQMIPELLKTVPKEFRPEGASGKVLKASDGRVVVKIKADYVQEGTLLDIYRLEKMDLGDDEEEEFLGEEEEDDDELIDEIYVGTVRVVEVKKAFCVCEPVSTVAGGVFAKNQLARISTRPAPAASNPVP